MVPFGPARDETVKPRTAVARIATMAALRNRLWVDEKSNLFIMVSAQCEWMGLDNRMTLAEASPKISFGRRALVVSPGLITLIASRASLSFRKAPSLSNRSRT